MCFFFCIDGPQRVISIRQVHSETVLLVPTVLWFSLTTELPTSALFLFFFFFGVSVVLWFYKTCKFSHDFDFEFMDQTLLRIFRTRRLADVLEPRYKRGAQLLKGDRLRFFALYWSLGILGSGGLSNFRRICVKMPTNSSSTLWLIPTEVSINLQSYDVAIFVPSENRKPH